MSHEVTNKNHFLSSLQYFIIEAILKVFPLTYFHKNMSQIKTSVFQ